MRKLADLVASCSQCLKTKTSQLMSDLDSLEVHRHNLVVNQRQTAVAEKEIDTVCCNQSRLRDNLERLSREHASSVVVRRYLEDMNRDEDTLLAARKKILELEETEIALKKTIAAAESAVREAAGSCLFLC
jgi:hypothetical protein